jgi:hypothetical protein
VPDELCNDEESAVDRRCGDDGMGWEGAGAADVGCELLCLPRTEEGGVDGVPVSRSRGSSTRGARLPDPGEGVEYQV